MEVFETRADAGRRLSALLALVRGDRPIVLGIPRGGVPVAAEIARALRAPLDVLVVRKLGVPGYAEFGFGAIGEGGVRVIDADVVGRIGLEPADIERVTDLERAELERRAALYRPGRPTLDLTRRTAIIVDDGVAMGGTMLAAIGVARALGAERVLVAVGVAPHDSVDRLRAAADEVIVALSPQKFSSVGNWYRDFSQVSDDEVVRLLGEPTVV
jgi:predicted phosphoribosyltransferase